MMRITVTGAGGMIGGHVVRRLLDSGHAVRAVDVKPFSEWWQRHDDAENWMRDLMYRTDCAEAVAGADRVMDFACMMGGIGFIESHRFDCSESIVMTVNMLRAAAEAGVDRFFKSSSACVYRADMQDTTDATALAEWMAYPCAAEAGYGEEKWFGERAAMYARTDLGLDTVIARYHNIAGPPLSWNDGKEKAPAAICRKVATAALTGDHTIDIWGDGEQTRSFCWIGDCVEGSLRLMASNHPEPVNIGSAESVTINELVDIAEGIAFGETGVLERRYDMSAPTGVRGRNSDNTECRRVLAGWEPSTPIRVWLPHVYAWVSARVVESLGVS
jgi:GDP-D-mannose 3', 5'-epimerase